MKSFYSWMELIEHQTRNKARSCNRVGALKCFGKLNHILEMKLTHVFSPKSYIHYNEYLTIT